MKWTLETNDTHRELPSRNLLIGVKDVEGKHQDEVEVRLRLGWIRLVTCYPSSCPVTEPVDLYSMTSN